MSFGNPSELFLLARIRFVCLILFSISACSVFVASTERKIGLFPSLAVQLSVCDACAVDHVVRFTRPSSLHFCILQAIKNWNRGRPGNEAREKACCFFAKLAKFCHCRYFTHVVGNPWELFLLGRMFCMLDVTLRQRLSRLRS